MPRLVRHERTGPIKVEPQDKPVFICGCGLSKNFPFCDGAHKICKDETPDKTYIYGDDGAVTEVPAPENDAQGR